MIAIAAVGRVSVGKSALLNALFGTAFPVDPRGGSTVADTRQPARFRDEPVEIIDTPGLGEVGQSARPVPSADVYLFVVEKDLTALEMATLQPLAAGAQPVLLVLNKADRLAPPDQHWLLAVLRGRVAAWVPPQRVVLAAAEPLREVATERPDGTWEHATRPGPPDLAALRDGLAPLLPLARQVREAERVVEEFCLRLAAGTAITPVPLADVLGGGAGLAVLVSRLAECLAVPLAPADAARLARAALRESWRDLWPTLAPTLGGSLLKSLPLVGWWVGATGQAVGMYLLAHYLGHACLRTFARGRADAPAVRDSLHRLVTMSDRAAIVRRARQVVEERLRA